MAKHITHNNKDVQQNAHRPALPNTYQQTVNKKTHKIGSTKLSQFAAAGIFQQQQQWITGGLCRPWVKGLG